MGSESRWLIRWLALGIGFGLPLILQSRFYNARPSPSEWPDFAILLWLAFPYIALSAVSFRLKNHFLLWFALLSFVASETSAWYEASISPSSTAGLGVLALPIYQCVLLLAVLLFAWLVELIRANATRTT